MTTTTTTRPSRLAVILLTAITWTLGPRATQRVMAARAARLRQPKHGVDRFGAAVAASMKRREG